jgi:aminoglycoside 2''-adenylyltransferase
VKLDELTRRHIQVIRALLDGAGAAGFPLWLESGWAIDARLGRITRPHEDIDVAYPKDREEDYLTLLRSLGFGGREDTDYGFLIRQGDVLVDTEACYRSGDGYGFPGYPPGSCPWEKEGEIAGCAVRCVSWEAMYVEFLGCRVEIPRAEWREKEFESLRRVEAHLDEAVRERLRTEQRSLRIPQL